MSGNLQNWVILFGQMLVHSPIYSDLTNSSMEFTGFFPRISWDLASGYSLRAGSQEPVSSGYIEFDDLKVYHIIRITMDYE